MFKLISSTVRGIRVAIYGEKTVSYQDTESLSDQAISTLKSVGRLEKTIDKSKGKTTLTGKLAEKIQNDIVDALDA